MVVPPLKQKDKKRGQRKPAPDLQTRLASCGTSDFRILAEANFRARSNISFRRVEQIHAKNNRIGSGLHFVNALFLGIAEKKFLLIRIDGAYPGAPIGQRN